MASAVYTALSVFAGSKNSQFMALDGILQMFELSEVEVVGVVAIVPMAEFMPAWSDRLTRGRIIGTLIVQRHILEKLGITNQAAVGYTLLLAVENQQKHSSGLSQRSHLSLTSTLYH